MKTHAQLAEARSYLVDDDGNVVSYSKFEEKVLKLNQNYNTNYLEAEYLFATQSAQSAVNWSNLENNTDRYWLQYRTAEDDRVRASHQQLAGVTLPKTDEFWSKFYPPNGWRCRCTAVEVLASKNTLSDSSEAIKKGEKATTKEGKNGKNTLEMFRFNPGKDKKLMPPKNTYSKVIGADIVKKNIETWTTVKTKKGLVRISSKHGKKERKENIEISSYFANKYNHEIDLIAPVHNKKTADTFNRTRGIYQEYKKNTEPTISAIDNAIRKGSTQANHLVLDIQSKIHDGDLRNAIKDRVTRTKNLKEIIVIRDNNDKTYLREDIIKKDWNL